MRARRQPWRGRNGPIRQNSRHQLWSPARQRRRRRRRTVPLTTRHPSIPPPLRLHRTRSAFHRPLRPQGTPDARRHPVTKTNSMHGPTSIPFVPDGPGRARGSRRLSMTPLCWHGCHRLSVVETGSQESTATLPDLRSATRGLRSGRGRISWHLSRLAQSRFVRSEVERPLVGQEERPRPTSSGCLDDLWGRSQGETCSSATKRSRPALRHADDAPRPAALRPIRPDEPCLLQTRSHSACVGGLSPRAVLALERHLNPHWNALPPSAPLHPRGHRRPPEKRFDRSAGRRS